jgi:amino acid transporter
MNLKNILFGEPLATHEEEGQRVGPIAAIPMLGLDALGSAAYGPEAALTLLIPAGAAGLAHILPITALIVVLLVIVCLSYRQTISAYPTGGGSYTVARRNLGPKFGLLAAAALLLDYTLVVAIGISAGVGALVSAVPALQPYTLWLCLAILFLIAFVNLRGVKESGVAFIAPTYLFIGTLSIVILIGLVKALLAKGAPVPAVATPGASHATAGMVGLWALVQSFASGCTAMTGVEAVSNGVMAFREPRVRNAQRTLLAVVGVLILFLLGIAFLVRAYGITATEPGHPGYESVLSLLVAAVAGKGAFYYVTMAGILSVLALSANTGFADFPRLCRIIAENGYLPRSFASRGRRLVYSQGIYVLTALAGLLLLLFGGVTDRLIPLFAVGAFLAFTLSQAGMVVHWRKAGGPGKWRNMAINGLGAAATGVTLLVVLTAKFAEGAWVTVLLVPAMLVVFGMVKRHYHSVAREVACPTPLDLSDFDRPIVIVPVREWNRMTHKGLRFAMQISEDVRAVQVRAESDVHDLASRWKDLVETPAAKANLPVPQLVTIHSPYRRTLNPILDYVLQVRDEYPTRQIAVLIPELVERRWYHYILHNQRAQVLKALLLFQGGPRVLVINVPWYLTS